MTEFWTVIIIFAGLSLAYFFGFLTAAMLAAGGRSDIETQNQLLAGRNRELEAEIAKLKENDKILKFQSGNEKVITNN